MRRSTIRRTGAHALLAAAVAVTFTGCDFQPADIPVPGTGVGGPTYRLHIEFADVLNLPQGAKVIADGVRVGQLTNVTLVDPITATPNRPGHKGYVIADVAVRDSVRLPVGTTAELRQETPLGDVHIALTEPANASTARIPPDATIPLARTTQSPPLEDILARLATFVGSGAVTDVFDIVRRANTVLPRDTADTARISGTLGADLTDLAGHTDSIHQLVGGIGDTVNDGILRNTTAFDQLLTPYGVRHTTESINATIGVIYVLTALGPLAPSVRWLGPLLHSLDASARAVVPMLFGSRPLDTGSPSNLKKLVDLLQDKIIPFAEHGPKINMVGVTVDPSPAPAMPRDEQTRRIIDSLRMIGAVR
ncbi:MlaD family protein [Nocardia miyunensis]|uniref:MlaD family protein n=1 Tax=Nocardia miyunensis TaxID=282684 RepID=UPI000830DBAF|nr:MlaD family protein [Nocardia miyunensis]